MTTVLITGLRGKTGREVAKAVARRKGVTMRGAGRNIAGLGSKGIAATRFDWDDQATWPEAVAGVAAIYLVKPKTADPAATVALLLKSATHLERVVLLSEIDAGTRNEITDERRVERVIEKLPFAWTILRPNWFMQNFSEPGFYLGPRATAARSSFPLPARG
jgi:uncharacterized protein YbjT (DUF2867 family)